MAWEYNVVFLANGDVGLGIGHGGALVVFGSWSFKTVEIGETANLKSHPNLVGCVQEPEIVREGVDVDVGVQEYMTLMIWLGEGSEYRIYNWKVEVCW